MRDAQANVDAARRRLRNIAVYGPPAILGAIALHATPRGPNVGCSPDTCAPTFCSPIVSCNPNNCNPVVPCAPQVNCHPNSCNPIG